MINDLPSSGFLSQWGENSPGENVLNLLQSSADANEVPTYIQQGWMMRASNRKQQNYS
jgi:hypothetical protein